MGERDSEKELYSGYILREETTEFVDELYGWVGVEREESLACTTGTTRLGRMVKSGFGGGNQESNFGHVKSEMSFIHRNRRHPGSWMSESGVRGEVVG